MGNGQIALETSGGYYVSAADGGGSALRADRTVPWTWETFTSTFISGLKMNYRSFRTYDNSHYFSVNTSGDRTMTATATSVGPQQSIRVECL